MSNMTYNLSTYSCDVAKYSALRNTSHVATLDFFSGRSKDSLTLRSHSCALRPVANLRPFCIECFLLPADSESRYNSY